MPSPTSPSRIWRLNLAVFPNGPNNYSGILSQPADFVAGLRPRHGIVLGTWDHATELGHVVALGVVRKFDGSGYKVEWRPVEIDLRPNPTGRLHWAKPKPYFEFKEPVRSRYMLDDLFAENFPEFNELDFGRTAPQSLQRPSSSPTGGYVYVIKSEHGYKIGKTVNLRERTRLFAVKLPFPISVEHYAWFEDYSNAEREFHRMFHAKRLEGEWFNLGAADLATIRTFGQQVSVAGL